MKVQIVLLISSDEELAKVSEALSGLNLGYQGDAPGDPAALPIADSEPDPKPEKPAPKEKPTEKPDPKEKPEPISDAQLKAAMKAFKSKNGIEKLQELLAQFDVEKASDLSPEARAAFAVELGAAS